MYTAISLRNGVVISARTLEEGLPEIVELPYHHSFIGVLFHSEFTSNLMIRMFTFCFYKGWILNTKNIWKRQNNETVRL